MAINNLPPQAYTRETVAEAFEWIKRQSPSTRELAKDANTLVSLYLNAKRHRRIKNMQPSDTAEFQNELKSLAQGIKHFNQKIEQPEPSLNVEPLRPPVNTISDAQKESIDHAISSLHMNKAPESKPVPVASPPTQFIDPQEILRSNQIQQAAAAPQPPQAPMAATQKIIQQTKSALNLSSDQEALNALVAMGYEQIKSIFKF